MSSSRQKATRVWRAQMRSEKLRVTRADPSTYVRLLHGNQQVLRTATAMPIPWPPREGTMPKPVMHGAEKLRPAGRTDEAGEQGGPAPAAEFGGGKRRDR